MKNRAMVSALGAAAALAACMSNQSLDVPQPRGSSSSAAVGGAARIPPDAFTTLKMPSDAHAELCAPDAMHPHFPDDADVITKTFCQDLKPGGVMPTPHSLAELQDQLGLGFKDPTGPNGANGNPGFALTGHSSSLVGRLVSALNPRAFVFTPPPAAAGVKPSGYAVLTFSRGEQFVEVAAHDPTVDQLNLYVVFFTQACNSAPGGCTAGDLLTPRLETGWVDVRVFESSTALNNTIADCKQCHQPRSDQPQRMRMQEIVPPFTHFFSSSTEGGRALLADYRTGHSPTEDYGPIPAALLGQSDPSKLRDLIVAAGFGSQPNAFDSAAIEAEVAASAPGQPITNVPIGQSATWQKAYDAAVAGQFIGAPYHDVKVTDPQKLAHMASAYRDVMANVRPVEQLPDIRDVFLDEGLRDMGFAAQSGLGGRALLVNLCTSCHNNQLDQTITRSHFNVEKLDQMSRDEREVAVTRLLAPIDSRLRMPPDLFRTVTDDERQAMIEELRR